MKKCAVNGFFNGAMCGNIQVGGEGLCGLSDSDTCTYQLDAPRPTPTPVEVKKKVLEKQVEAHLYKQMKKLGGECYKWSSMNMRGVADRICIFPPSIHQPNGIVCLVELKKDSKAKLSANQIKFHNRMAKLRVQHVYVLHGKEEVNLWLKSMGY